MKPLNGLKRYYFVVITDVLTRLIFAGVLMAFWPFGTACDMPRYAPMTASDLGKTSNFSHSLSWTEAMHCMHPRHLNYLTVIPCEITPNFVLLLIWNCSCFI